jgi:hypothetical protein
MEALLIYLTDDFQESIWTMQEVGYALGANKPVISLKVGQKAPPGFVGHVQALSGSKKEPQDWASQLFPHITKLIVQRDRLQASLIASFVNSPSFDETKSRFNRLDKVTRDLSDIELKTIIDGFSKNDQLYKSIYLTNTSNRILKFLDRTTGQNFVLEGRQIHPNSDYDDDVPF